MDERSGHKEVEKFGTMAVSTVVVHSTTNPESGGSNPVAATHQEKIGEGESVTLLAIEQPPIDTYEKQQVS